MKKISLVLITLFALAQIAAVYPTYQTTSTWKVTNITSLSCSNDGWIWGKVNVLNTGTSKIPAGSGGLLVSAFDHNSYPIGNVWVWLKQIDPGMEKQFQFGIKLTHTYSHCWYWVSAGNVSKTVGYAPAGYYPPTFGAPWYNQPATQSCWINKNGYLVCGQPKPYYDCWKVEKGYYKCGPCVAKKTRVFCNKAGNFSYQCPPRCP